MADMQTTITTTKIKLTSKTMYNQPITTPRALTNTITPPKFTNNPITTPIDQIVPTIT